MVNKALGAIGSRFTNRYLGGTAKVLAMNAVETGTEEAQYLMTYAVQDLAHAFAGDTRTAPAEWYNGRDGAFDGFWSRQGTTFVSMLPFAALTGGHGGNTEARDQALAGASSVQRRAFGITGEDSAAIDAAVDPASRAEAIRAALANRDPGSGEARAATEELEKLLADQQEALRQAQDAGLVPRIVGTADGMHAVLDGRTGRKIGTAKDLAGATRIATIHMAVNEKRDQQQTAEGANPYRDPDGSLKIPQRASSHSDPALANYQKKLFDTLNDVTTADALYDAVPDSRGGKVIGTDIVRELLPEFAAGREGKLKYTHATGQPSQAYAKDRLWREIENPKGRKTLMFTAGGVAAGKSTVVTDELVAQHDLVFDGTLRESDWAIETIERALEKGWDVRVNYIQRPIDLVVKGAIDRAERSGRWGSVAALPGIHQAAQQSMLSIARHFDGNPNVRIALWLNDGETIGTLPKKLTLAQIDKGGEYSYDQTHENTGTTGQGRSERPSDSQRFRSESVERTTGKGTEGTGDESAGRASVVRRFREAIASGGYSPEVLKRLAQGDPELEGYVEDAFPENDVKDGGGSQSGEPRFPIASGQTDSKSDHDVRSSKTIGEQHQDKELVGERHSKVRDQKELSYRERWRPKAKKIHETVDRHAADRETGPVLREGGVDRSRHLFAKELTLTPEEIKILRFRHEILLIHTSDGRLKATRLGEVDRHDYPWFAPKNAILTHNHPGGRGPSGSDLRTALENTGWTMRVITKSKDGKKEIFQFKALREQSDVEIGALTDFYVKECKRNGDTAAARRMAMALTIAKYPNSLDFQTRTIQ